MAAVFNPLAADLGIVKTAKTSRPNAYGFNCLGFAGLANNQTVGAGEANTSILSSLVLPQDAKIAKVGISFSAIDSLTGDSFNIVVGNGSYTQGAVAPGDNSLTYGYPTAFATAGDALFSADVALNATNVPGATTASGGSVALVPTVYDAVYPAGAVLTLRATTNASTGSISGLSVTLLLEPVDPQPNVTEAVPNVSF